ncbi:protein of unknown function [Oceanobacillus limi]|uniref:Transglutaminase-like domain-containing protein n=1 Tax=Oceanobacillus limi TaxID=930131 RepID=A0A1I0E5H2_9BACI|nr:transglutaminase domain-containing protein [Oceanobacillus limi]SET39883.1 protein of unknown function [Oceanobacillus limi]
MRRSKQNQIPIIYTSILYILGLLLFLEWLYPIEEVTDTTNLSVFIIYTMFCFIITLLKVNWWISFSLKGFGLLFIINGLFSEYSIFSKLWIQQLVAEVNINIQALLSQQWDDLSGMFRSILFLFIIWLMSYLIHYWFVQMKRIFAFVILTFIYLTVLDTFTVYDGSFPIIRTFAMAFIGLGMANFFKEIQMERITFTWARQNPIWIIPLILIVLFSTAVGYAAPKFEPQWPDPVPFIQSATGGSGGSGGIRKVGYGEDDSRLGGSFVQDDTTVFQAASQEKHYWRIESKDVYTGKGWINSDDEDYAMQQPDELGLQPYADYNETEELETFLEFQGNSQIPKLVYPYGTKKVDTNEQAQFLLYPISGAVRTEWNGDDVSLSEYSLTYDYPSFSLDKMREAETIRSGEFLDHYTQLPSDLPERVNELADEITESFDSQYDKVKAVESYFARNGFEYQTSNVPTPGEEQDYVDQFLFDSKIGYCDNFSTSMVVLLRSLDIPARWVKGFTSGEPMEESFDGDSSYTMYEVTNSNAHSWVEVYFEEIGWVPFEPTQGFTNLTDFYTETDSDSERDELEAPERELEDTEEPDPLEQEEDEEAVDAMQPADPSNGSTGFELKWWHITIGGVILLIALVLLYLRRFQMQTYLLERKWDKNKDSQTYQDAYHFVLKVLKHQGFTKDRDQTLREYATRVDTWYHTDTMGRLTAAYEKMIYKNDPTAFSVSEMRDLWKNLIKQILG